MRSHGPDNASRKKGTDAFITFQDARNVFRLESGVFVSWAQPHRATRSNITAFSVRSKAGDQPAIAGHVTHAVTPPASSDAAHCLSGRQIQDLLRVMGRQLDLLSSTPLAADCSSQQHPSVGWVDCSTVLPQEGRTPQSRQRQGCLRKQIHFALTSKRAPAALCK